MYFFSEPRIHALTLPPCAVSQFVLHNLPRMLTPGTSMCSPGLAFLLQFGMFGSLSWFGCMSLDLYFSVTRPFTRPSSRLPAYQMWVWAGSMLTGAVAAMRHGDRPVYNVCWIGRTHAPDADGEPIEEPFLASMWGLFFIWLVAYSLLSVAALVYVTSQLRVGGDILRRRLLPRLTAVNASRMYTAAFSAYWAAVGAVYICSTPAAKPHHAYGPSPPHPVRACTRHPSFISTPPPLHCAVYVRYDAVGAGAGSREGSPLLRCIFAAVLSLMGSWDAAVWCIVQRHCYPGALALCCAPARNALATWRHGSSRPSRKSPPRWISTLASFSGGGPPPRPTVTDSDVASTPSVGEVSSDEHSSTVRARPFSWLYCRLGGGGSLRFVMCCLALLPLPIEPPSLPA